MHNVTYYTPLTHYRTLDIVRLGIAVLALLGIVFVLVLAVQRWQETRRSASYYLAAIAAALFEVGLGSVLALGHPFNWTIPVRVIFVVLNQVACATALREYRQPGGLWDNHRASAPRQNAGVTR